MKEWNSQASGTGDAPPPTEPRRWRPLLRRFTCLLLCFCMLLTVMPCSALAAKVNEGKHPFADVSADSWYNDAVQYVYEHGIFSGTGPTTFTPEGTMTRGMFVTVLGRMAGVDTTAYAGQSAFRDVSPSAYYAPYVAWAAKHGVTSGTSKNTFSPDALINRQEMAAFFVRYFEAFSVEYDAPEHITTLPADLDKVSDWTKESVLTMWKTGLLVGDGTNFNPMSNATRAQAATLCMRIHKAVKTWFKEPGVPSTDSSDGSSSSGSSGGSSTRYYEVKFDAGNKQDTTGLKLPDTATFRSGTKISELSTPYQAGKVFLGWYYDQGLTKRAETGDVVNKNMTLYAKMMNVDEAAVEETPNYLTKTDVDANNFVFYVEADSIEDAKAALTVTQITANNTVLDWKTEDNADGLSIKEGGDYWKVTGTYQDGQTYQAKLAEDSNAVFVVSNDEDPEKKEVQPESVRELNFITAKEKVDNLKLQDGLVYLKKDEVEYNNKDPLDGLFTADAMEGGKITSVKNNGSFTYNGKQKLKAGDTVAIYKGVKPDEREVPTDDDETTDNDDAIIYVTVTNVSSDGKTISYTTADTDDVLFTPDVLPVSSNTHTTSGTLTLTEDDLDFSKYDIPGLNDETTIDVGDYIAFYSGTYVDDSSQGEVTQYARVTGVSQSNGSYTINYEKVNEDDVMAAMDLYSETEKNIYEELTAEGKDEVIKKIEDQVKTSGYAETAIETLSLMALEADDLDDLKANLNNLEGMNFSLRASNTKNANDTKKASDTSIFDALKELKKNTEWKNDLTDKLKVEVKLLPSAQTHFEKTTGSIGVLVSLEFEVEQDLDDKGENKLTISVQAEFEQDIMISVNTSGGAVWKKKWIFPYIADYQLNANLDVGTYTGISTSFTMNTGEADDEDDDDDDADDAGEEEKKDEDKLMFLGMDWSFLWGGSDEDDDEEDEDDDIIGLYAERFGKKIDELVEDGGDFLGDDDEDDDDDDMLSSLREQYAELIEDADDAWINLVDAEIFSVEGSVDPLHILVYGVSANFVIKANACATLGATFEYGNAKRYNFSVLVSEKKTTSEVLDLETPNCQFVFYIMGTMGLRAGVELELAVGLCSLKLDSVGISAEAGAYATACGFFYYKWLWEAGTGTDSVNAGAFHSEIGAYVEVKFNAQLFSSDSLTYEKQLYENQWPWLTLGDRENVYSFNYMLREDVEDDAEGPTYEVENATTLTLPTSLFDMAYMDMQSGECFGADADDEEENPAKNYYKDEDTKKVIVNDHFDISLSNNKFEYHPETNTITITPNGSVEETCEMTLTWRGNSVAFSSKPISMTVTIEWSDLENARYIAFDSQGGSVVNAIARTAGASITAPPAPTKTGYTFAGWYEDADYTKAFTMPTTMPDYSNEDKGITVYAKWIPSTTSYKVEYYEQELNGTYTLENTVTETGTTDEIVPTSITTTTKDGFTLNTKKSTTDQTIAANGSTVVKLYYDRAKYKLTFAYGVDGLANLESQVKYGAEISAPILHRDGYTFAGWTDKTGTTVTFPDDDENPRTMPAGDVTYTATWTVADTSYKVKHYKQTAVGGSYELCETETIVGTTGQQTNAVAKSYPGYEAQNFEQQSIDGNGSTVVRILYNISGYKITYDGLASDDTTERTNSFTASGTSFKLTPPTKTGYTFKNWTCNNNSVTIDADGTITIPTGITENITITANWTQNPVQLLDPNGNESSELTANSLLPYTISYTNNDKNVNGAIVAYWVDPDNTSKHYYNGDTVEAGVATLKAVLMGEETPMEINSKAQLEKIVENANDTGWLNGNYKLVQTVELSSGWTGIGTSSAPFTGTFDGNRSRNNMIVYNGAQHPLFNCASGATIKNLITTGSLTCADQYVGGVVGYAGANCTISNCTVQGGQIIANGSKTTYVGGVVGYATGTESELNSVTISDCIVQKMTITGSSTAQDCYVGGIAGCLVNGKVDNSLLSYPVYNCTVTANSTSGDVWTGGAVGLSRNSNFSNVYVLASAVQANSVGNVYSGGIAGEIVVDKGTAYEIFNCMVAGQSSTTTCTAGTTGTDTAAYAAGVVGRLNFSSDTSSEVTISGLVISNSNFTATGTKVVAAEVIGEIQSNGKTENKVSLSSRNAIDENVTAKANSDTVDKNVQTMPTDATTGTGSNNETIITCPATT